MRGSIRIFPLAHAPRAIVLRPTGIKGSPKPHTGASVTSTKKRLYRCKADFSPDPRDPFTLVAGVLAAELRRSFGSLPKPNAEL